MKAFRANILGATVTLLMATGCGVVDQELAEASVSSALSTSQNANFSRAVVDDQTDDSFCFDELDAAAEHTAHPAVGLYPSECVVKTQDGAFVHSELSGCTGPFGRVEFNGGIDTAFDAAGCGRLSAKLRDSGDLTRNGEPAYYDASARVEVDGDLRYVDFMGHWETTTNRGAAIEHDAELDLVIDRVTDCFQVDGNAHGTVGRWTLDAEVTDLEVCPSVCPSRGVVSVLAEGPRRALGLTVTFDGSDVAEVLSEDGDTFAVEMDCEASGS